MTKIKLSFPELDIQDIERDLAGDVVIEDIYGVKFEPGRTVVFHTTKGALVLPPNIWMSAIIELV